MSIILTEQTIVPDVFLTGVIPEDLGDNMRFTGFIQQNSFSEAGGTEYYVVNRVIMPRRAVLLSIQATMKALGVACCGGERLRLAH
ncbi:hypothetical protein LB545_07635 [Mesorhizobium sp. BR1-1-6]|uniref:hypothetical protein n=1 Tax=Mesorhizobium sp. BR1-1-6 TaxID=2876648 RepID=UPI001CD141A1|nr:hypothetical protein [Mesorhizobium sp. BR1-1-6]MBZ9894214.1 hypothetical protein [Mesorhizobium sp. BR1-1-6]